MNELSYFSVEGAYGGNQDWHTNLVMHIGGCAALVACDSLIYFAKDLARADLYPFDLEQVTKEDYKAFGMLMKPYISPRIHGVKKLAWYKEGLEQYLTDYGITFPYRIKEFSGDNELSLAKERVRRQIDGGKVVPFLLLKHQQKSLSFFTWHWFLITGYEEEESGEMRVTVATYAKKHTISFDQLWDTGYEEKGGMILYEEREGKV
ncbi:hypothetical protein M2150_001718 [Lachnospiraceae bacterium PM6-15]|uniref:hypothetical protein n=1 Tax=Ohessyouella blattaphilus TaxID=2949333 RepID=UPI003E183906